MSDSWEEFVTEHLRTVLAAAVRVLGSAMDAEDVAQEVFVEVFRSGRRAELFEQPALVRTIATRRALDRLRQRRPTWTLGQREISTNGSDPVERAIANELSERVRFLLGDLPPREAEVFCLACFEQLSHAEVARVLGISPGAVAKALCKARETLALAIARTDSRSSK